ncbi:MAG: (Fe-S)-binding protein [Candidatus Tectomicrobia bacterium]|uniref:Glycolate oxidase iron-sulfur subunit n=1 Tax=Tectimicrobiota bacterium TaxID=2528274 RepID=A0A932GQD7_UNCTE|nr:(Fe-S)-binding protein [Candidatus Tectomicrobia bacterium]
MAKAATEVEFRRGEDSRTDYYRGLLTCVHCGLCLPACPTYRELGTEMDSPRGRISLMRAAAEGRIDLSPRVLRHIDLCLGCRACEPACPSGVPYGSLLERTRVQLLERRGNLGGVRKSKWVFRALFAHTRLFDWLCQVIRFYQVTGIQKAVRRSGVSRYFPEKIRGLEEMLPAVPARRERRSMPEILGPAEQAGEVSLFAGCVGSTLFGRVNRLAARVLVHHGFQVQTPARQVCCGALQLHNGDREGARALASRNVEVFAEIGSREILVTAAGCGAVLKGYGDLLDHAPAAVSFSSRVKDISEFLGRRDLPRPSVRLPLRVTYQDPCHLAHVQGIRREPRLLLASIPGVELVEMPDSDRCCGSAGTYTITEFEMSMRLLKSKMGAVAATGAQAIVTANPGCHIQLEGGTRKFGPGIPVYHVVELLARAYGLSDLAPLQN